MVIPLSMKIPIRKFDAEHYWEIGQTEYSLNLSKLEEKLAATWCFDYFIPLKNWAKCNNTFFLIYENLVKEPEKELGRLEDYLQIQFPGKIYGKVNEPSATTVIDSHVFKNESPLTIWKARLTKEQIRRVLNVIGKFKMNFWTDDLKLNKDRLEKFMNNDDRR